MATTLSATDDADGGPSVDRFPAVLPGLLVGGFATIAKHMATVPLIVPAQVYEPQAHNDQHVATRQRLQAQHHCKSRNRDIAVELHAFEDALPRTQRVRRRPASLQDSSTGVI